MKKSFFSKNIKPNCDTQKYIYTYIYQYTNTFRIPCDNAVQMKAKIKRIKIASVMTK